MMFKHLGLHLGKNKFWYTIKFTVLFNALQRAMPIIESLTMELSNSYLWNGEISKNLLWLFKRNFKYSFNSLVV